MRLNAVIEECSSNLGITQLELGIADTISETRSPVRRSKLWSKFVAAGVRFAGSVHVLLFSEPAVHDLVDGGFDKRRADRLSVPVALAEVRDELLIVPN